MEKNELTRIENFPRKIERMKYYQLKKLAKKKSAEIFIKIEESSKQIQIAKEKAKNVANMKYGIFGKKKVDALAEGDLLQTDIMSGMNDLIQESIKFTCISTRWAQVMHEAMTKMMVSGFKDSNGNIHNLDEESKKFAQSIIEATETFRRNQLADEKRQRRQDAKIADINNKVKIAFSFAITALAFSVVSLAISVIQFFL